jgi:hypothetical protein
MNEEVRDIWIHLIVRFSLVTAGPVLFMSDGARLGLWTMPSVAPLIAGVFVVHDAFNTFVRDDGRGANS